MILEPWAMWGIIGIVSGCVLGLAGAGGGLIAIPILIHIGGYSIKAASGYGLLVVSVGALLTWLPQRKNTHYIVTLTLLVFAFVGAYISVPWKVMSPTWLIIIILNLACLFSLYSLWIMKQRAPASSEKHTALYSISRSSFGGFLTGILTTMVGLGGGVIMVPWLNAVNRLSLSCAVASSLLTIAISAPYSAYVQGYFNISWLNLTTLVGGSLLASLTIKEIAKILRPRALDVLRKVILTSVIIVSMVSTLSKLF